MSLTVTDLVEVEPQWHGRIWSWIEPNTVPASADSYDAHYMSEAELRLMASRLYPDHSGDIAFDFFVVNYWASEVRDMTWAEVEAKGNIWLRRLNPPA